VFHSRARIDFLLSALHHIYLPLQQRSLSQMSGRGLADFPPVWPQKQTARRRRRCLFCCTPLAGEEICASALIYLLAIRADGHRNFRPELLIYGGRLSQPRSKFRRRLRLLADQTNAHIENMYIKAHSQKRLRK
jgi:hypothetical protein